MPLREHPPRHDCARRRLARSLAVALVSAVTVAAARPAAAEEPTPVRTFRSFDPAAYPGAPVATVWGLLQDARGVLWIATTGQLHTFDGQVFRVAQGGEEAPLAGHVRALVARRDGGIYVAHNRGVSSWNGLRWSLLPLEGGAAQIGESDDGGLWALDAEHHLLRWDGARRSWSSLPQWGRLDALLSYPASGAWGLRDGVAYRIRGTSVVPFAGGQAFGGRPTAIAVGPGARFWVATSEGEILSAAPVERAWRRSRPAGCTITLVRDLAAGADGRLWIGDNSGELCFGDDARGWSAWGRRNGLKPSGILSLLLDREGSLWIGFNGHGVQQWLAPQWSHRNRWSDEEAFPARTAVTDIAPSGSRGFLASVMSQGIWHWDGGRMHSLGAAEGLSENTMAVHEPRPGVIWVGARGRLYESVGGRRFRTTLRVPQGFVSGFFRSPAGASYAVTTHHGVFRHLDGRWVADEEVNERVLDPDVRAMLWTASGELWVGTRQGVTVFAGGGTRHLRVGEPRMPTTVSALLERVPGEVWIAGIGGVRVVGRADRFLTEADGMPGRTVSSLAQGPDGAVWMHGSDGVTRLRGGEVTRWDGTSGLIESQSLLGSLWVSPTGDVYAGMTGALSRFDAAVEEKPLPPVALHWQAGPGTSAGSEQARERTATWSWLAPALVPPAVEYRVRARGIFDAWTAPQTAAEITVPNLPTGRWSLEVSARRRGSSTWSAPLSAAFVVPPRRWETPAARFGIVSAALGLLGALVRLRTRHHRARAAELERQVRLRTAEVERVNVKLAELARTDGLTGLRNRAAFDELLTVEWERARRSGSSVAILLGDVDHFKRFNDHYGHPGGDACLRAVAELVGASAGRPADCAARYGGEEFVVLLPDTDLRGAEQVASALLAAVRDRALPHAASPVATHVTMSLGVAAGYPAAWEASHLVAAADAALYAAKQAGRDRHVARQLALAKAS